jgi:hypothetical protein
MPTMVPRPVEKDVAADDAAVTANRRWNPYPRTATESPSPSSSGVKLRPRAARPEDFEEAVGHVAAKFRLPSREVRLGLSTAALEQFRSSARSK